MSSMQLPRSTPELQGIASEAITNFLKAVHQRNLELHSFMLLRHGQVAAEGWWQPYAPEQPHMLFSLSKSFTSTAIGLLAQEGRISLEDYVVSFFPDEVPADADEHLLAMRIRHLLMMGTGHAEDTTKRIQASDNWVGGFLSLPVEHEPGTHFVYNSGATYMLSAIVQKVAQETLLSYLQPRLLAPLGIEGAAWESCPRGINVGGWGLKIKTEDIAKFGQLYLQKGIWNGERLLSEEWVEEATSKQISNGSSERSDWEQGYGYQFWRCRHGVYRGDGAFGQFCVVMPEQNAVVAITSGLRDMQSVLDVIWEHLLPAMGSDDSLPADASAAAALSQTLQALSLEPPREETASPLELLVSGAVYDLEAGNAEQIRSVSFQFSDDRAAVQFEYEHENHTVAFGRNEWLEGSTSWRMKRDNPVFASMTWRSTNTLSLTLRYVETPFYLTITCIFGDSDVSLEIRQNVLFGDEEPQPIKGTARSV